MSCKGIVRSRVKRVSGGDVVPVVVDNLVGYHCLQFVAQYNNKTCEFLFYLPLQAPAHILYFTIIDG